MRNDQDKTLAKERKNGLKNLPDKDGFVASNAIDSHLTGNPNYDPDTVKSKLPEEPNLKYHNMFTCIFIVPTYYFVFF